MSHRFAVVAEAPADHRTATELADRILIDATNDWLDEDQLPYQREWVAEVSGGQLTWKRIRKLAADAGIEAEGFFDGEPGLPDARAARRALRYLHTTVPERGTENGLTAFLEEVRDRLAPLIDHVNQAENKST